MGREENGCGIVHWLWISKDDHGNVHWLLRFGSNGWEECPFFKKRRVLTSESYFLFQFLFGSFLPSLKVVISTYVSDTGRLWLVPFSIIFLPTNLKLNFGRWLFCVPDQSSNFVFSKAFHLWGYHATVLGALFKSLCTEVISFIGSHGILVENNSNVV